MLNQKCLFLKLPALHSKTHSFTLQNVTAFAKRQLYFAKLTAYLAKLKLYSKIQNLQLYFKLQNSKLYFAESKPQLCYPIVNNTGFIYCFSKGIVFIQIIEYNTIE